MDTEAKIRTLARDIQDLSEELQSRVRVISPDSISLEVVCDGRLFLLDFCGAEGFGVDEYIEPLDGLGSGYRHYFDDLHAAGAELKALIQGALQQSVLERSPPTSHQTQWEIGSKYS